VISRMVTCDADNLFDYQSVLTSTHTNCLIQFVKERLVKIFFVSTEARILRFPQSLSSVYFEVFLRETRLTSNTWLAAISRSGWRIIQHLEALSTTISTAFDHSIVALPAFAFTT